MATAVSGSRPISRLALDWGRETRPATHAEIIAATAGRPSLKAVPRSLERLAGLGYLMLGPDPSAAGGRLLALPWRIGE